MRVNFGELWGRDNERSGTGSVGTDLSNGGSDVRELNNSNDICQSNNSSDV